MAITEESRYRLHSRLKTTLGDEEAATLMEHLPPIGWADVATKQDIADTQQDIARLAAATKQDIARLAAATQHDIAATNQNIARLAAATKQEFSHLVEVLDHRFEALDGRFEALDETLDYRFQGTRDGLTAEFFRSQIRLVFAIAGTNVALLAIAATLVQR